MDDGELLENDHFVIKARGPDFQDVGGGLTAIAGLHLKILIFLASFFIKEKRREIITIDK